MTLFDEIKEAGIEFGSYETDLHLPDTAPVRAILERFPLEKSIARRFRNQINRQTWIDIPFAYIPAWEAKAKPCRRA